MIVNRLVAEMVVGQVNEAVVEAAARRAVDAVVRGAERAPRSAPARQLRLMTDLPPEGVRVKSETPGRIRLAIPWLRGDRAALLDLLAEMRGLAGLREASASTRTGTLLVLYDPAAQDARSIADAVRRARAGGRAEDVARLAV